MMRNDEDSMIRNISNKNIWNISPERKKDSWNSSWDQTLEVVEESGRVRRTNTTGLNGSMKSQVKGVDTTSFGSSIE